MARASEVPFFQVDAFSDKAFAGNPAAVCILDDEISPEAMLRIAGEMNLSETAFVQKADADGVRKLQWFTPKVEVPLCGHATLATSHVLIREMGEKPPIRFETLSGILTVEEEMDGWIRMDFPVDPPEPAEAPKGLLEALGCPEDALTLKSEKIWVVRLDTQKELKKLKPDFTALGKVKLGGDALGVSVTSPGTAGNDFASRFFGPWVGVNEDPVTGMAHTVLGPYWMDELDATALRARQVSARGGNLRVRKEGDRISVSGQAITVVKGTLKF
ncbi:MAG: PhzF family phenazine biosynthesis protein [Gemmatimonadetes bacterium]|nr:PhzF family phenazine biosynthesis protein [Gemmatimonadota bacterium]NNM04872.1 PhzF family phenazine biosynthesis protein [Gemmatimonadota bacterium]